MSSNIKFFKSRKSLPVDKFFETVLYDKKLGYYNSKQLMVDKVILLLSEYIKFIFRNDCYLDSLYLELYGKPKYFNIVELGPGDGSLARIL